MHPQRQGTTPWAAPLILFMGLAAATIGCGDESAASRSPCGDQCPAQECVLGVCVDDPNNAPNNDAGVDASPSQDADDPQPADVLEDSSQEDAEADTPEADADPCDGAGLNACGGCGALDGEPGDVCGPCQSGQLVCDDTDKLVCEGDSTNECGGCQTLDPPPGGPCGPCDLDTLTCDGTEQVACDGATPCPEDFVRVPAGSFEMGSPDNERGRFPGENLHTVTLSRSIQVKTTEVTQAQWASVTDTTPSQFTTCDTCPVERINWFEALEYLNRLSAQDNLEACYTLDGCTGTLGGGCVGTLTSCDGDYRCSSVTFAGLDCEGFRLPTEAEWEYFTRAGTQTPIYSGDTLRTGCAEDRRLSEIAWFCGNSDSGQGAKTQIVGTRTPNDFGIFDASGNVYEWVWDNFSSDYYLRSPDVDPLGPDSGDGRVVRGGAFNSQVQSCRSAARNFFPPTSRNQVIGLRPVRTIQP